MVFLPNMSVIIHICFFYRYLDFSQTLHDSFKKNSKVIQKNLHLLHPVMQTVADIGYVTFSPLVLADLSEYR